MSVALNTKHLSSFISEEEYAAIYPQVEAAHNQLEAKSGPGNDFLGWMYLPRDYDKEEFARIKEAAAKIREDSDVLVVAGIGGSYLGGIGAHYLNRVAAFHGPTDSFLADNGRRIGAAYAVQTVGRLPQAGYPGNVVGRCERDQRREG